MGREFNFASFRWPTLNDLPEFCTGFSGRIYITLVVIKNPFASKLLHLSWMPIGGLKGLELYARSNLDHSRVSLRCHLPKS